MTASQLPLAAPAHRNQQLFSDHYLDQLLPQRAEWQALAAEAAPVMQRIAVIARGFNQAANEAQLEEDLARPILRALGHSFEVQAALQTPLGTKRPDYVFFRDEAARQAQRGTTLTDEALRSGGIAVGDAKAWDRPLDVTARAKQRTDEVNANPSYQIAFYIQHSGMPWGILTNGRLWRLFHRDTAHKLDRFYEVDLFALLERDDPTAFLYFYAFFRRAAFDAGPLGLDALLTASQEYARAVGDTLKAQVYDALRHMAQGFLDHPTNGLQPDPATLAQIYDNSLIVLYRLLFILYAEARELLPLRESQAYRNDYSLQAIKRRVAQDRDYGHALLPTSTRYWSQLRDLFGMIDRGSPPLKIAAFNGGLFDPQRHTFLERYSIGDARLQHAVDLLARVNKQFVDYRDLAERHLGTIYEGLLEYHLEALTTTLTPADPLTPGPSPKPGEGSRASDGVRDTFTIQLLNDKGERKATGSYYTPDYIVKYIVDQTVGPVLRRAVAGQRDDRAIIAAVLATNVLDPAMGSGHFLVEATDYIASFLVDLGVHPDEETGGEADVAFWKRRVAQSCIYGVDLNPLAVDLAKLSLWLATVAKDRPLSFLDHHLRCGNALVGARLADLQVGSQGAGAQRKAKKAKAQPQGQLALFDEEALRQTMSRAVGSMWLIEASAAHSVADVKEQEQAYQSVRADLNAKYGRLADLVTATHFGLQVDQTLWNPLADYATGRSIAAHQRIVEWLAEAERIAQARRFFHWELEFPEVFFDQHGQPLGDAAGFDAVVGNPPYIRSIRLKEADPQSWLFYSQEYTVAANKEYDIYLCFVEAGLKMLHTSSYFGMIIPNKWFTTQVGEALRVMLSSNQAVNSIVNFGAFQVFENVTTYTCLLFLNGTSQDQAAIATLQRANDKSQPLPGENGSWIIDKVSHTDLTNTAWSFVFGSTDQLLKRLRALPQLQNVASVFMGTGTRADQVFFAQSNGTAFYSRSLEQWVEIEQELMKPTLTGRNIDPYHYTTENYLLFPYKFVNGQPQLITPDEMQMQFPKAWAYLNIDQNRTALEGRDKGEFKNRSDWYGYGRPQNMHLLGLPKVVLPDVVGRAEFAYDDEGRYIIDTVYAIRLKEGVDISLLALTTLLNSSLMTFFLQQTGTDLRGGYFRMKTAYLNPFPIPHIAFSTPADERARLVDAGRAHYAHGDPAAVLAWAGDALPRMADGAPDAANEHSDAVHDLLAFLAEQMIAMHTQRHAALEDLLLDLEGVLPPGILAKLGRLWTPPRAGAAADEDAGRVLGPLAAGRIELRDDIGALSEEQWKWLVRRRVTKLDSLADVVRVFRRRQPAVAALDARIAATDRLIDQIVYRLYTLTDDEIAVVEGNAGDAANATH